jgi:multidrug efflux pump
LGTSSGSRTSLGIAVVGGLIFAGILTLYVIPSVYSYFSRAHVHKVKDEDNRVSEINKEQAVIA